MFMIIRKQLMQTQPIIKNNDKSTVT